MLEILSDVRGAFTLLARTVRLVICLVSNEDPGPLANHISQVLVGIVLDRRTAVWDARSLPSCQLHSTLSIRQFGCRKRR